MIFHSIEYLVFLPLLWALYWMLRKRTPQNLLLLVGSYFFYGFVHPWFLSLIVVSTLLDYGCARAIVSLPERRRWWLGASLLGNLGLLGFFKYYGFFAENVALALISLGLPSFTSELEIVLPVGISFYTFQTMSYTIDVYRGSLEARKNLLDFALYVSFFPQLVAGPIERAGRLLPQMEAPRRLSAANLRGGLLLLCWGFFKKLVIADSVAIIANKVFALQQVGFVLLWTGVLAFCIQIFADFSAYTDIARGSARLLGFELMQNFHHPYLSLGPAEFWRRWHASLSTWIRDYVYIPLGGSRGTARRQTWTLVVTFLLCGLWHGASWNFVLWGLYHGVLLATYRWVQQVAPRLFQHRWLIAPRWATFFALTNLGWLMFRERDLERLAGLLTLNPLHNPSVQLASALYFLALIALYSLPLVMHAVSELTALSRSRYYQTWQNIAALLCVLGALTLQSAEKSDFIYFQF